MEGEIFDPAEVRSSLAPILGLDYDTEIIPGRRVDAIAELMLDATRNFDAASHRRTATPLAGGPVPHRTERTAKN